jgi:hypothetical protein
MRSAIVSRFLSFLVVASAAVSPALSFRPALAKGLAETITTEYVARISYSYAVSECLIRRVSIQATEGTDGQLFVNVQDFNPCTGEEHPDARTAFADLSPQEFSIDPNLERAKLRTTVMACHDGGFACIPVKINLTWEATGPAATEELPAEHCGGTITVTRRPATVSGRVRIENQQSFGEPYFAELIAQTIVCP